MNRPRLHVNESGPDYEKYDSETDVYERAQEETFERERDEKSETSDEKKVEIFPLL